jgi:prepilin-type N-terminal cleavage/methylation domain-containing protein
MDTVRHIPKQTNRTGPRLCPPRPAAFTLIELLVVIAILGILVSLSVTGFSGIGRSQRVSEAVAAMNDAFELSFHHARSRGVPVWLAVATENPGTPDESIRIRKYTTKDGARSGGEVNKDLIPLSRDRVLTQVRLAGRGPAPLKDAVGNPPPTPQLALGEEGGWIFISPGGEVRATGGSPDPRAAPAFPEGPMLRDVEISVMPANGPEQQTAMVQFSGLTGISRVFRP